MAPVHDGAHVCTALVEPSMADSLENARRPPAVADPREPLRPGIAGPSHAQDGGMPMPRVRAAGRLLAWIALALGRVAQGAAGEQG